MKPEKTPRLQKLSEAVSRQGWMIRLRGWLGLQGPEEMFARIRNRLTISYSSMLMLFLISFILIVYALLFSVISREQEADLQALASQELLEYQQGLSSDNQHTGPLEQQQVQKDRFFYYVIGTDGKLLQSDETYAALRPTILHHLHGWKPRPNEVRYTFVAQTEDRELMLLMAGREITNENGQTIGMLYTGKDVTFYMHTFLRLLEIFVGLLVLFFLIATLAGHFMAKRAMVPIMNSFFRQREFVADASHELRTPLTILQSSVEVVELEEGDQLSEYSRKVLLDMKDEVGRMSRLVADLLTLARSDAGSAHLYVEAFDLVAVAEQLLRTFQHVALPRQIELVLESPQELIVSGDKERLKQLLYILLDNAVKYTNKPGHVVLSLQAERVEQQSMLVIEVRDQGIGIELEQQERIFDRFFRSDKIRSREMGGTGLGLSIAKLIVEAHHGSIAVRSQPGQGSTFTVYLPQ